MLNITTGETFPFLSSSGNPLKLFSHLFKELRTEIYNRASCEHCIQSDAF